MLAFDYGEKRIGVAVGNTLTRHVRALTVLQNRSREYRFEVVGQLIAEWKPMPVSWVDERYLSVEAKAEMKRNGVKMNAKGRYDDIDAEAARVILQQYLAGC
ncbi:putative Holliday junction resolvase YggF [Candidatus Burkholderia crenata]|nr:putative Holliday junction resolvase YggF [Candidatus Burkholderia crenata]